MEPKTKEDFSRFRRAIAIFSNARNGIPRFHLPGVPAGRAVAIHAVDPATLRPLHVLGRAVTGADGWVDLPEPLIVRAGEAFVVVPEAEAPGLPQRPLDAAKAPGSSSRE